MRLYDTAHGIIPISPAFVSNANSRLLALSSGTARSAAEATSESLAWLITRVDGDRRVRLSTACRTRRIAVRAGAVMSRRSLVCRVVSGGGGGCT